ncbi:MAG TPA: hypothetical protein PKY26_01385 [Acetivibrio clariflavus]|nr:hypothetical protein [Acetivibrio clariflavus]
MNRKFIAAAIMNTLLIFAFFTATYADDCIVGRTPDGVYPMEEKDIVMVSEDIYYEVEKGFVECNFVFKNTGKAKDVLMGFPAKMESDSDNAIEERLYFKDFKTYLDDTEIPVNTEKGKKPVDLKDSTYPYYSEWYTFNVHFAAGETKNIRNTYKVESTLYSNGDILSGYILKTGAFWKDTIGHAKVTFDLGNIKPYEISRIFPFSMKYEGENKLVWERSNFEPEFDLEIMYNNYRYDIDTLQNQDYIDKESLQAAIDEVKKFEELKSKLDGMSKAELMKHYTKYLEDEKIGIAKYIQSKLPENPTKGKEPVIKEISVNEGIINCIAENENRDYAVAKLKVTHTENGVKTVDYDDSLDVNYLSGKSQINHVLYIDLSTDKKYDIEYLIKDSYGNMDVKKIKYPYEQDEQSGTIFPESSGEISNDANIPETEENITNDTSFPLPEINYDDGTNKIKISFVAEKRNQNIILLLVNALLLAGLLVAFILTKRNQ